MNDGNERKSISRTPPQVEGTGGPPSTPQAQAAQGASSSIEFLMDIPLELTVEVGRRSMLMGELINVMPGTIIELERPAGEKIDVLANGKLVARGEAVVVGDRYGVRVLEIAKEGSFLEMSDEVAGGEL